MLSHDVSVLPLACLGQKILLRDAFGESNCNVDRSHGVCSGAAAQRSHGPILLVSFPTRSQLCAHLELCRTLRLSGWI